MFSFSPLHITIRKTYRVLPESGVLSFWDRFYLVAAIRMSHYCNQSAFGVPYPTIVSSGKSHDFSVHFDRCTDNMYQDIFSGLGSRLSNLVSLAETIGQSGSIEKFNHTSNANMDAHYMHAHSFDLFLHNMISMVCRILYVIFG